VQAFALAVSFLVKAYSTPPPSVQPPFESALPKLLLPLRKTPFPGSKTVALLSLLL
jgi:hypothetical protein